MRTTLTILGATALLLGTLGLAAAQTGTGSDATGNRCWDESTGQVRDRTAGTTTGSSTTGNTGPHPSSRPDKPPPGAAGASPHGGPPGAGAVAPRPPEAADLPNCAP